MAFKNISKNTLLPLTWLAGTWVGTGNGQFPTMPPFKYLDKMTFKICGSEQEPLIHFEETAWIIKNNEQTFKHCETGYFRPLTDTAIELQVTHNTGRIEILNGVFEEIYWDKKQFNISFNSTFLKNAKGLTTALLSHKKFNLTDDLLKYSHAMSTSKVGNLTNHLIAELKKS